MTFLQPPLAKFSEGDAHAWDGDGERYLPARAIVAEKRARPRMAMPIGLTEAEIQPPARQSAAPDGHARMTRCADITLALALLLFALPLMILIALAIKVFDPGPALFAQQRIGRGGIPFRCLKFRSMVVDSERRLQQLLERDPAARLLWNRDRKLADDPRITPIGKFLRISSLDELPQLWNVVRGEMSLVGPRPIVEAEVPRYGRYIHEYCSVRPGITGLWQVTGRSGTTYRRRVALDVTFARSNSLGLYVVILARTVPAVALARGSC